MQTNWLKLSRCITSMDGYLGEPFCKPMCFIDLLINATHKAIKIHTSKGEILLQRGELSYSIRYLAKRWSVSVRHCRTVLNTFVKEGRISVRIVNGINVINIVNYNLYQGDLFDVKSDTTSDTTTDTTSDTTTDTIGNGVNIGESTDYNDKKSDTDTITDTTSDTTTDTRSDTNNKNNINKNIINKNNIKKISTNVDIKESRNQNEIDFEKLCELWNQQMIENSCTIPQIQRITDRRKQAVLSRLREFSKDEILKVIENCARSDFLNGRNNRNFIASFDWAFLPNNFIKILEGNYNNKFENNPSYQNGLQANTDKYFLRRGIEPKDYDEKDYHTTF